MIVVTGGTGHIGNVLVRKLLQKGEAVRVIIPPFEEESPLYDLDVDIVKVDIRNSPLLIECFRGAKCVFHLAGIVSIMPGMWKLLNQVNVLGTKNVVEACLKTGVKRLVYTSSVHAFIELPHGNVISENTQIIPAKVKGDYGKSKALATHEVLKGVDKGLDAVIVHPSGVIGPYEYKLSNTGYLVMQFVQGRFLFYINGGYDFVDVRDVAEGLIQASDRGRKGENYILSGKWVSLDEIIELLREITGKKTRCFQLPLWVGLSLTPFTMLHAYMRKTPPLLTPYSIHTIRSNSAFSHEKATREWGYSPRPLKDTLKDTIHWLSSGKSPL